MWSTELPHLVSQDRPIADVEPLPGSSRRRAGWLLAGTAALLLGGGVTASLAISPQDSSLPVGAAAVAEELPQPREAGATALNLSAPEPLRAIPPNAGPRERPESPSL